MNITSYFKNAVQNRCEIRHTPVEITPDYCKY